MTTQRHCSRFLSLLLAVTFIFATVACVLPMSALAAGEGEATLFGGSVYRSSAANATVRFLSSVSGTAYYQVTETATAPSTESMIAWTNGGAVTANATKALSLTMTAGAKYVHIVVQNGDSLSNVLTASMPCDFYYSENFEAYPLNTYVAQSGDPLSPISQKYGGTGSSDQKVTTASDNKYLSLSSNVTASVQGIDLPSDYRNGATALVLKGKVMPIAEGASYHEAALFGLGDRKNGVLFINGEICRADKADLGDITYSFNRWYEIELDLDFATNTYDIKVDGITVASDLTYNDSEKFVTLFAGHGTTAYFDDIELYTGTIPIIPDVDAPVIAGNSVFRSSATEAAVHFLSDKAGTVYYQITESATAPSTESLAAWTNGGAATANATRTLSLTTTTGAKYVHIVVDGTAGLSNVLTVAMPSDYCYSEDFEAYPIGTYIAQSGRPMSPISQINNGTGDTNQKVANGVGTNSTKMLSLSSNPSWASDQVVHLDAAKLAASDCYVFEGDVYVLSTENAWQARFSVTDGSYEGNHEAGIFFKNGKILAINSSGDVLAESYTANAWHHVKLVLFPSAAKYKVYFDGELLADDLAMPTGINRLAFTAGHSKTAYYDNFAFYQTNETYSVEYFKSFSITLGSDIKANCYVNLRDIDPDDAQVRFTMNGKTVTVDGAASVGEYKFVFEGVAPQCMGDTITAELLVGGVAVETKEYTVLGYLNKLKSFTKERLGYTEAKYNAMVTLIDDTLVYGGAAQTYVGYKMDALVSNGVTGSAYTMLTAADDQLAIANNGTNVTFATATLYFDNVNRLKIKFATEDTEGLVIKCSVNGGTEKELDFTLDASGKYVVVTSDILAVGFDDLYTFTAYKNDVAGATLSYSVRSYVYAMQNSANVNMVNLAKATYNYGLAAKAFAGK